MDQVGQRIKDQSKVVDENILECYGARGCMKILTIKWLTESVNAELVLIQDFNVDASPSREIFHRQNVDWVLLLFFYGVSGGIIIFWDKSNWAKVDEWIADFSVSVVLRDNGSGDTSMLYSVMGLMMSIVVHCFGVT